MPNFEERRRSRFEWGLIADIQPPDIETKVAILRKKAEAESIALPNDVAFFLASQIDSNIRILEGSLIRIGAFASLTKTPIDMKLEINSEGKIIRPFFIPSRRSKKKCPKRTLLKKWLKIYMVELKHNS